MFQRNLVLLSLFIPVFPAAAAELEWIKVSDDQSGFVHSKSGRPFTPWGFNYDHERNGLLLEDYWDDRWSEVESDFQEMKEPGATVTRIHIQFGKFMDGPDAPNEHALNQLSRLLNLAEETGIYIDLTGLGCYHKQDVPEWYDAMEEPARWAAQAAFWDAVAEVCANSPAIFCYDLMNEPVVPGGRRVQENWLGPAFGDKHFVQFITRDRRDRERPDVAREWIQLLSRAIRRHDSRHLITVGLVDWSLERPGLQSGFVPARIADELDFLAVHIYPESGKLEEALETLHGFAAAGKPVVIEETFTLKCGGEGLERFFRESRGDADGWIGFYWGKSPEELAAGGSFGDALMTGWLNLFQRLKPEMVVKEETTDTSGGE